MVKSETSNVPPPRSNTRTFFSEDKLLLIPNAIAAADGSFMILRTFNPEMIPASLVDVLCESLKYAGTVMTASLIGLEKCLCNFFHLREYHG